MHTSISTFSLKFVDIMIGMVLGLGFQWWISLHEPWQYIAFVFIYFNLVDYWIDYSPTLKKFPPKHELDVMIHLAIAFTMFLLTVATQATIFELLSAFVAFRIVDLWWIKRICKEHKPTPQDRIALDAWTKYGLIEIVGAVLLGLLDRGGLLAPLMIILIFVAFRVTTRVLMSMSYQRVFFA